MIVLDLEANKHFRSKSVEDLAGPPQKQMQLQNKGFNFKGKDSSLLITGRFRVSRRPNFVNLMD